MVAAGWTVGRKLSPPLPQATRASEVMRMTTGTQRRDNTGSSLASLTRAHSYCTRYVIGQSYGALPQSSL